MAHKYKETPVEVEGEVKKLPYRGWLVSAGILLIMAASFFVLRPIKVWQTEKMVAYPTAYELGVGTHAVPISPGQWSGWVSATRGTSTYSLRCPADCEVIGWDGSRLFIKSGKFYPGQAPAMPIKISGQGPAIITIS